MRRVIICTAAFAAVMWLFSIVWRWFVYSYGASWIEVGAFIGVLMLIGAYLDRQRDAAG